MSLPLSIDRFAPRCLPKRHGRNRSGLLSDGRKRRAPLGACCGGRTRLAEIAGGIIPATSCRGGEITTPHLVFQKLGALFRRETLKEETPGGETAPAFRRTKRDISTPSPPKNVRPPGTQGKVLLRHIGT